MLGYPEWRNFSGRRGPTSLGPGGIVGGPVAVVLKRRRPHRAIRLEEANESLLMWKSWAIVKLNYNRWVRKGFKRSLQLPSGRPRTRRQHGGGGRGGGWGGWGCWKMRKVSPKLMSAKRLLWPQIVFVRDYEIKTLRYEIFEYHNVITSLICCFDSKFYQVRLRSHFLIGT